METEGTEAMRMRQDEEEEVKLSCRISERVEASHGPEMRDSEPSVYARLTLQ